MSERLAQGQRVPASMLALLAAVTLLWGVNWPAMKLALIEMPPLFFRVFCVFGGGVGLFVVNAVIGQRSSLPLGRLRPLVLPAVFNITGWHMTTAFALRLMEPGRASIIAFTMPVWAALLSSVFLGERIRASVIIALALGGTGIALLIGPDIAILHRAPIGAILMLLAAISWASGTVAVKRVDFELNAIALTAWQLMIGGIPIMVCWLVLEPWPDLASYSPRAWGGLLYAAFVAILFCLCAYFKLVTVLPATVAAISVLAVPVVGLFSSALILDETVGLRELAALVLVVAALGLTLLPRRS